MHHQNELYETTDLEFINRGKYQQIINDVTSLPITQALLREETLTQSQVLSISDFYRDVRDHIADDKHHKFNEAMVVTIEEKIGNSIAGTAYSSFIELQENSLKKLVYALCSLQMLADLGDTIIDAKDVALSEIDLQDVYNLVTDSDSALLNFLKRNVNELLNFNEDEVVGNIFRMRWDEFALYQICSSNASTKGYIQCLEDTHLLISTKREVYELSDNFDKEWLGTYEYVASKGGTTYLLHLLRILVLGDTIDLREFDRENTLFDYLNFLSDHVVDIATDNGYLNLEDLINNRRIEEAKLHNNILQAVVARDLGITNIDSLNSHLYADFVEAYYKRLLTRVYSKVSQSQSINARLIKPMVQYFFMKGQPSKQFSNSILNFLDSIANV